MKLIDRVSERDLKHLIIGAGCIMALAISSVVVHEYSHIIAMRTFYTNINPYMGCNIYTLSCHAYWNGTRILHAGSSFTEKTAFGIVNAAGPLADMAFVAISAIIAWNKRRTHLKVALVFATTACLVSLNTLTYALITRGKNWGDFLAVQTSLGISHDRQAAIVGAIFFTSCVLITHLAASAVKKLQQRAMISVQNIG